MLKNTVRFLSKAKTKHTKDTKHKCYDYSSLFLIFSFIGNRTECRTERRTERQGVVGLNVGEVVGLNVLGEEPTEVVGSNVGAML